MNCATRFCAVCFGMAVLLAAGCGGGGGKSDVDAAVGDGQVPPDGAVDPDTGTQQDAETDAEVPCEGDPVARFDTAEVVLHASRSFDGNSGTPNPFTDVTVTATVIAPGGRNLQVDGFFDGDGAGGATGDVFKVRIGLDEPGTWTWTISSSDSAMDGQSGSFCCTGTLSGVFGQGPVTVNPTYPRTLMYSQGTPVYLVGKFLDVAAPNPIQFSHTMFSEQLTNTDRQNMLDRHAAMHLNKINVYLANVGDYGGVSTTPWVGSAGSNDKTRFDLSRWQMYDTWTRNLRDAGLVAQLWFFADDSGFGGLADADRQRLIRYGMARLSGYVNTMFTLCLEWQEGWSTNEVDSHAQFIQDHNPFDRLSSVHGTTGDFAFPNASWADYMDIQSGNNADHATVHSMGLTNRALAAKPLINEEFGLGDENTANRQKAWAAFTAGAAGSGTGAFLQHLADFVSSIPFEQMEPADNLVVSGNAYGLAQTSAQYVFYLPGGGSVQVDLSAASGTLNAQWFDPRTGSTSSAGSVSGGSTVPFNAPDGNDWTLYLTGP